MTWVVGIVVYCTVSVVVALLWCAMCRAGTAAAPTHHGITTTQDSPPASASSAETATPTPTFVVESDEFVET
ncbi:hypothetical protein BH24ACT5_BH24ACT5_25800 [soil metagenome]